MDRRKRREIDRKTVERNRQIDKEETEGQEENI